MDSSLQSTSSMAASYENNEGPLVKDPMEVTISETMNKLDGIRREVGEVVSRITYLRGIRTRALQLLAQADSAEEEAARLEVEQSTLEREVDRLNSVVSRMEDMRYSTKQLTTQMELDTALQMRHILENGKSIVPRVPNPRIKRSISDDSAASEQPFHKMPRRDPPRAEASSSSVPNGALSHPGTASSPTAGSMHKFSSPNRSSTLTPGGSVMVSYASLSENASRPTLVTQGPFVDVPPPPSTSTSAASGPIGSSPSVAASHAVSPPVPGASVPAIPKVPAVPMILPTAVPSAVPSTSTSTLVSPTAPYSYPPPNHPPPGTMFGGGGTIYGSHLATALGQKEEELEYNLDYAGGDDVDESGGSQKDVLYR